MLFKTFRDYKASGFVLHYTSQNMFVIQHQSQDCTRISLPLHVSAIFAKHSLYNICAQGTSMNIKTNR